jgi:hypothetical protein
MTEETTFADQANNETSTTSHTVDESGKITVGDRTFDNTEALVTSWLNGQTHITTLESEREGDREALTKAATMEEVLNELKTKQTTQTEQTASTDNTVTVDSLTKEDVNNILAQRDAETEANANVEKAMTVAKESLGTDFVEKLESKAKELGMSEQDALDLAKKSPSAFTNLFVPSASQTSTSSFGDINADAIPPKQQRAESARVDVGATGDAVVRAWNAAAPT